ncbi:MAG: Anti sigma-E protein RseA, N-terminal domain [Hydrocarboniphaga sp.]|uniref:sigma-E factor negative regulatory protein n=1 Tax=Hydrocarboniphaga sp. TaxID=2033016 RepID=UPI0026235AFD|nr:sigma-E factor negative regulatory protein [Hydrocarboniphaga sp.]MDB5967933.1 Anti sigma-E protein RseA, N-terminal domain [Hydrocarboniphaga sp.]
MSQESLSALVDGECSDAELDRLLASLDQDTDLARRWSRWHLRRDIAEGIGYLAGQPCICADVMAALEEPKKSGRVVDLVAFRRRIVALPWKPAVGFAAAASMGAAAVLFLAPQQHGNEFRGGSGDSEGNSVRVSNPLGNTLSLPGTRAMGRLQSVSLSGGDNSGSTFADEEYAALLRDYVASRNNAAYADASGQRYARFDSSAAADAAPRQ